MAAVWAMKILAAKVFNVSAAQEGKTVKKSCSAIAGGQPLMGRKGLGKLDCFGIAHRIVVTSERAS